MTARFGIFEIGMNHAGEITPLARMVRPHVAIVTTVEPVHLEFFPNVEAIARAKAEIFLGVEKGGAAIVNRDNPHYTRLAFLAREAGIANVIGFGEHQEAAARLEKVVLKPECSCVSANILGEAVSYKVGAPGRHLVQNSLAVLAAVSLLGGDLARAAHVARDPVAAAGPRRPPSARRGGWRNFDRRELQRQPRLDAGGDHPPWRSPSPPAAAAGSPSSATCSSSAARRRRFTPRWRRSLSRRRSTVSSSPVR